MACPVFSVSEVGQVSDLHQSHDIDQVVLQLRRSFERLPFQEHDPGKLIVDFSGVERLGNSASKAIADVLSQVIDDSARERYFVVRGLEDDPWHGLDLGLARMRKTAVCVEDGQTDTIGSINSRGAAIGGPEVEVLRALDDSQSESSSIADLVRLTSYSRSQLNGTLETLYEDQGLAVHLRRRYLHVRWFHRQHD